MPDEVLCGLILYKHMLLFKRGSPLRCVGFAHLHISPGACGFRSHVRNVTQWRQRTSHPVSTHTRVQIFSTNNTSPVTFAHCVGGVKGVNESDDHT